MGDGALDLELIVVSGSRVMYYVMKRAIFLYFPIPRDATLAARGAIQVRRNRVRERPSHLVPHPTSTCARANNHVAGATGTGPVPVPVPGR